MKFKSRFIFLFTIFIALLFCSCDKDEPTKPSFASRTILVYMVANNSLGYGDFDKDDISEMLVASGQNDFNSGRLLIYHAPVGENPSLKEISNGEVIIRKKYDQSTLSVTQQRMQQVINDVKEFAPAYDYGLILWSHANGWLQNGITSNSITKNSTKKPLTFGDDRGNGMNITTLSDVISDEGFSFIYFDCCYMGSIEVAYELRNATPYIVASAAETPADGMPYDYNLPLLFADTVKLKEACMTTFDYYNCQNGSQRSCVISLIDTRYIDELAQATAAIYSTHPTTPKSFIPQKFTLDTNCYYFDFKQYIEALSQNSPSLLNEWEKALDKVILYKNQTPYMWNMLKLNYHCGLSTFILESPEYANIKNYNQLQWWNDVANKLWDN